MATLAATNGRGDRSNAGPEHDANQEAIAGGQSGCQKDHPGDPYGARHSERNANTPARVGGGQASLK
jgi:hypothetical protein